MKRPARFLTWLTLIVAILGWISLYLVYRPSSASEALGITATYAAQRALDPWVLGLVALAVVANVGAWALEQRRVMLWNRAAGRETHYALDASASKARPRERTSAAVAAEDVEFAPLPVSAEAAPPTAARAPALDPKLRTRLARHLGRRPDLLSWLDDILIGAIEAGASDVHVQPQAHESRVTFRIEGTLTEVAQLPRELHAQLLRRLKVMARLPPYRTEAPQDGRLSLETPDGTIDVRVAIVPTQHGEKAALRLGSSSSSLFELGELGLPPELLETYTRLLAQPQGLIVATGPTGSGKTTTLYASLLEIYRRRSTTTQISTIEEPIELDLPFANQTEVHRGRGLTFASGLRALLRQDPDVLMVGEIRDRETATTAVEAGLTGHLILTTLHADSAAGVFNRLIDLEIEPFLVASATLGCISQRLARRLCPHCREPTAPSAEEAKRLLRRGIEVEEQTFFRASGCSVCLDSGFSGRVATFELLEMTRSLRQQVTAREPTHALEEAAIAEGMVPLVTNALRQASAGWISLDELLRVVG